MVGDILCARDKAPNTDFNMMVDVVLPGGHAAMEISKSARRKMNGSPQVL